MHVGAERAGRLPGDQRQPDEGARPVGRRHDLVPHRCEDLLLAGGSGAVVLVRSAAVLADPREAKRLAAGEVVVTRRQRDALAAEPIGADAVLQGDVDSAERVDQLGEVREAHQDQVVDLDAVPEELLHGLDRECGAAERVGGVDPPDPEARDGGLGVAQDRELANAAEAHVEEQDAVRARRPRRGSAGLVRAGRALIGPEHEDRAPRDEVAASREGIVGAARDTGGRLGAHHEDDDRQQDPAADRDRAPFQDPPAERAPGARAAGGHGAATAPPQQVHRALPGAAEPVCEPRAGAVDPVLGTVGAPIGARGLGGHAYVYTVIACRRAA